VAAALVLSGREIGLQRGEFDINTTDLSEARVLSLPLVNLYWEPLRSAAANRVVGSLLTVNILWGLINLLPIYPLDGGQVSREVCTLSDPRRGMVASLQISMAVAAIMAAVALFSWDSLYSVLMFGYLSYLSYRTLEAYRRSAW
jgi:stage IV sporulation protein FB